MAMRMIDAHAHIFNTLAGFGADGELRAIGDGKAIWANGKVADIVPEGYGDHTFTAESLLSIIDSHDVERAVLLQGGLLGFNNYYLHKAMTEYPDRFIAAAAVDPFTRELDSILDNLLENLRFRLFKFESSTGCGLMGIHDTFQLDSPRMLRIYDRIAEKNGILIFDLGSPGDESHQVDAICRIAERYKNNRIVICHLSSPRRNHREILEKELRKMSRENIAFDLAALNFKTRPEDYPFPVASEFAALARKIAGDDRLMWGTDAPTTLCRNSFEEIRDYLIPVFSGDALDKFFYKNALEIYWS